MAKPDPDPPEIEARDWSVRGLPRPSGALRAQAQAMGVPVYDGVEAAEQAGFPMPQRWGRVLGWLTR